MINWLKYKRNKKRRVVVSFVVVAYNMQRELPRTIQSLSRQYQEASEGVDYEVIVVDNGSPEPLNLDSVKNIGVEIKLFRMPNPSVSPAAAINFGVVHSSGDFVAIMIDGARMLSPGVVRKAYAATRLAEKPLISVLGLHLGPGHQRQTVEEGYSKDVEDKLLNSIDWRSNGYRLFEISSWGGSSPYGWLGSIAESNCIILARSLFVALGGYDEAFTMPGGGLVNLDFYKRAVETVGVQPVYLFGEGCFHQLHGGVTTGSKAEGYTFEQLNEEYRELRGEGFVRPAMKPMLYGDVPDSVAPVMYQAVNALMGQGGFLPVGDRCRPFMN